MSIQLTTYAFASAGVIFSRILQEHRPSDGTGDLLPQPLITKSYHLQELHRFLDALSSIQPTEPHFQSCRKALQIFSKVNEAMSGTVAVGALNRKGKYHRQIDRPSDIVSSEYSPSGLNSDLRGLGALPWLDHVWIDSGDAFVLPSGQIDDSPFTATPIGLEYWDYLP